MKNCAFLHRGLKIKKLETSNKVHRRQEERKKSTRAAPFRFSSKHVTSKRNANIVYHTGADCATVVCEENVRVTAGDVF